MLVRAIYALAVVQFLVATALMLDNMELLKQLGGGPKPPTATAPSPPKTKSPTIPAS
jgi:hypothetical protein